MQYDIIIVGFGIVGNTAALLLAKQGLKVAVCESLQKTQMQKIVKAGRIDREVLRIYEQLDLHTALMSICKPLQGAQLLDNKEHILLPIDEQGQDNWDKENAPMYAFYQPQMQSILQQSAQEENLITLYEGCEVNNIEQVPNEGVIVVAYNKVENKNIVLKGKYLLVCSGAKTPISKLCNITPVDYNYSGLTLNVETKTKLPFEKSPYSHTFYHASMPITRILYASHSQRWEIQLPSNTPKDKVFSKAEVNELLLPIMPQEFEVRAIYTHAFSSSALRKWYDDYIIFAGDAAHTMAPYLGLNLSAGIKDVHNIAWKLALLIKGAAQEKLMLSYQIERENSIHYAIKVNTWIGTIARASRWQLLRFFMPLVPKSLFKKKMDFSTQMQAGVIGNISKYKGRFIPNFQVLNIQGKKIALSKILGMNFNILALDINPVDATAVQFIEALAFLKAQFFYIKPQSSNFEYDNRYVKYIQDIEGDIEKWLQKQKAKYIIVRPDGIIFDVLKDYRALNESLQLLCDKLYLQLPDKPIIETLDDSDILAEEDDHLY